MVAQSYGDPASCGPELWWPEVDEVPFYPVEANVAVGTQGVISGDSLLGFTSGTHS